MFGYIVPDKPELKIKEYEFFRAYYCGVCKSMGRNFGVLSRFTLNYDTVFLALLLSSLHHEKATFKKEVCFANPLKKKWIAKNSPYIDLAADINVILTYYKLKDNWADEKQLISLGASMAFMGGFKKAKKKNPEIDEVVAQSIAQLSTLEKQKCRSMDAAAEPFANMMKYILKAAGSKKDEASGRIMEWIGYNIGKWIYLIDAYDDIEKDIKSGSYNPIVLQYQYDNEGVERFKEKIKPEVEFNLIHTLGQTAKAVELLNLSNEGIIENIIYLGMHKKTASILSPKACGCGSQLKEGVV